MKNKCGVKANSSFTNEIHNKENDHNIDFLEKWPSFKRNRAQWETRGNGVVLPYSEQKYSQ